MYKFTDLFKQVDDDQDGILDEEQFRRLIEAMNVVEQAEIDVLLQKVDPFNNQKMTYSEIVHLLSSHMADKSEHEPEQIPLLEKFINAGVDPDLEVLNNDLPGDDNEDDRRDESVVDGNYTRQSSEDRRAALD